MELILPRNGLGKFIDDDGKGQDETNQRRQREKRVSLRAASGQVQIDEGRAVDIAKLAEVTAAEKKILLGLKQLWALQDTPWSVMGTSEEMGQAEQSHTLHEKNELGQMID